MVHPIVDIEALIVDLEENRQVHSRFGRLRVGADRGAVMHIAEIRAQASDRANFSA
jgi:hypothetical protein